MHEMGIKTDHRSRRIYVIESNLPPRNTKHSRTLFQIKTEKKGHSKHLNKQIPKFCQLGSNQGQELRELFLGTCRGTIRSYDLYYCPFRVI